MDTVVKSRIVNQDDQAHSIYAEYEIVDQNGQVVSEKTRSEAQAVLAGQEINLSQTLHVEKPTLDVKTDHPALYTCIRGFIGIRSWSMCKRNALVIAI